MPARAQVVCPTFGATRFTTILFGPLLSSHLLAQATLLNSYLVQLLDNGFLHADPHPGNFLLQDDGTLCVLDFGLMTEVSF